MVQENLYSIYPATIGAGTPFDIEQMRGFTVNTNVNSGEIIPGGTVDRGQVGVIGADYVVTFRSRALAHADHGILDNIPLTTGVNCTGTTTFRLQERALNSTFESAATTTHETWSSSSGFTYVSQITASNDDYAEATCVHVPLSSDGILEPLTHNAGVAISGATPSFVSSFFMGPVTIDGATLGGIVSHTVDAGIGYEAKKFTGYPYCQFGAIKTRLPRLSFTTVSIDEVRHATAMSGRSASIEFWYWDSANYGTRASVTGGGMKIAATAMLTNESFSVQDNDDGTATCTILPTGTLTFADSENVPTS